MSTIHMYESQRHTSKQTVEPIAGRCDRESSGLRDDTRESSNARRRQRGAAGSR